MMWEYRYIRYEEQDVYREAGWTIRPFSPDSNHFQYALIAKRKIEQNENV